MERKGLISVIIPVYNVESYLRECVDSVLNQTHQYFEIILVDDGSTDHSSEICDVYVAADDRISCIHKENGGASTARNAGLDAAQGEYVFFLDSDDWLEQSAFEKLITPFKDSDIYFTFCEAYAVDEDTGEISRKNYAYHRDYGIGNATQFFEEMLQQKEFHVAVWMILYRRAFLTGCGMRFVEKIMYEDCIFAYQVYRQAEKAAHIHEYLYYRRYRKNSVMTSKKTDHNFVSAKRVYEEVISSWKEFGEHAADEPYVVRIAYNAIENYRALNPAYKEKYAPEFNTLKKNIIENNAFSDKGLKASCYGKLPWILYKVSEKLLHR